MKEASHQDKLLHTVNNMASILLASNVDTFKKAIIECLGMLAKDVEVDRTYVWENYLNEKNELYCTQVFEWSGGADPQQGNELTVDIAFPEDWYDSLSINKCVSGIVANFPKREREHLQAQGIMSILVVPVFLQDRFWGFVGFDDCHNIRTFSRGDESILRSASLLIATAMSRNEITEKLMQAREEALSSTKAKSNFLSNMSHEIRTPINAITGMTAIARQSTDINKITACLDKIDAASYQLLGLVNDILDINKIEAGKMELSHSPFDLFAMIDKVKNIISIQVEKKQQFFVVEVAPEIPQYVIGDDVRLSQILINLLSNAVKFTPEKGSINLLFNLLEKKEDSFFIETVVCDTGIGIAEDQRGRLFHAFEQADRNTSRNYGGTGLGLAISKNIAKLMDGDVAVNSREGEGSCFIARYHLKAGSKELLHDEKGSDNLQNLDFSKYAVLLAEDIEINREIVLELLKPTQINIDCAEDGKQALEMFKKDPDKYNIIFMDIQMPEMNGYDAAEEIRAIGSAKAQEIPIIAMTANAYKEDVEKALACGMNGHLSKPIDINAVIKTIQKYLK